MIYDVVRTGSDGNFTVIGGDIGLDMGVPFKTVKPYLQKLRLVFCGHEHSDHFKASTIREAARTRPTLRFCGGPWMVDHFIAAGVKEANIDVLEAGTVLDYGDFQIEPVPLFHNVQNFGLKIYKDGEKALYIVDTGHLDGIEAKGFDLYLLEANHTRAEIEAAIAEAQAKGEFTYRTRAAENHLSYEQAVDWLTQNMGPNSIWIPMHGHKGGIENDRSAEDSYLSC